MGRIFAAVLGATLASAATAQQAPLRADAAVVAEPTVRIQHPGGAVRVTGWDRDSIAAVLIGSAPDMAVRTVGDRESRRLIASGDGVALEVRVPSGTRLWVKGEAGDIEVSGVSGPLELATAHGRIRVDGAPRQVSAETMDGNIEIAATSPLTRVRTANGTIVLRSVTGDVSATSVTGPINAGGNPVTRGRFETVSGDISFKGRPARDGVLEFVSHSGAIELRLPPDVSAEFDVSGVRTGYVNELAP
ncbi:MAG: DUF4097 family beta strand repeat-containing protein, partial [Gemmatimonadota bacterium]